MLVCLFYRTPDIGYNWDTDSGNPFDYFSYGAAVSEVEIDCLTGDHTVSWGQLNLILKHTANLRN